MLDERLLRMLQQLMAALSVCILCISGSMLIVTGVAFGIIDQEPGRGVIRSLPNENNVSSISNKEIWIAPDTASIPSSADGDLIRYGRELIAHTALYLGPKGKVNAISNGMNCQNCHLNAGTVPFGNNYSTVAATYPKFRHRSGTEEGFEKRINDCIERSLNGKKLDEESKEMSAMVAYIKWVGKDVPKGDSPLGSGLVKLPYLNRPADPLKGALVYKKDCAVCHGTSGEGAVAENGKEWQYPPLYGKNSYNNGGGLYRLSRFAAFVKANMPFGVTFENPVLSDEEAWDVAAYINAMPRPEKDLSGDWPDISKKPVDHPYGPYADGFTEEQHKYGPFGPIETAREKWN